MPQDQPTTDGTVSNKILNLLREKMTYRTFSSKHDIVEAEILGLDMFLAGMEETKKIFMKY